MDKLTAALIIGFIIDLLLGDPHKIPHPVVFIGIFIKFCESKIRNILGKSDKSFFYGGVLLFFAVASISYIIPATILYLLSILNGTISFIVMCIMCWQIIAAKSLKDESMKVYYELERGDIVSSRKKLSMIVGRDTENLSEKRVIKATVETIAENTSDGVIAPIFYMAIGGPCLGFLYKAVNTMDSMIGYKNDKYMFLGRFAAKADDVFNFIPSRVAALIMIIAVFILKLDYKNAVKIFKRDRFNHKSPNSAQTESVCAGALNIRLAGDAYYFGKLVKKPYIGDDIKKPEYLHIILANKIMYASAFIMLLLCVLIRIFIITVIL